MMGPGETGNRPVEEMLRHASAETRPAPRMTMREMIDYDRWLREKQRQGEESR